MKRLRAFPTQSVFVMTDKTKPEENQMWGGRFSARPLLQSWRKSTPRSISTGGCGARISPDPKAHADMLAACRRSFPRRATMAPSKRGSMRSPAKSSAANSPIPKALEDIHMNIEARLKDLIGEPAGPAAHGRARATIRWRRISAFGCDKGRLRPGCGGRPCAAFAGSLQRARCRKRRRRHAGLHAFADRPTGHLWTPSSCLYGNVCTRRQRALTTRQARMNESPSWRGGARRHVIPDRPRPETAKALRLSIVRVRIL